VITAVFPFHFTTLWVCRTSLGMGIICSGYITKECRFRLFIPEYPGCGNDLEKQVREFCIPLLIEMLFQSGYLFSCPLVQFQVMLTVAVDGVVATGSN
jgi:hypothetical protein